MALTGYRRTCGRRSGGIKSIVLIPARALKGYEHDPVSGCCLSLTLYAGAAIAEYRFKEDEAVYAENVTYTDGFVAVSHTLAFTMERMDPASRQAVEELAETSRAGVIAVVTNANDISVIVGWSEKFGTERPLRLTSADATSGRKPTDITGETVTLFSEDSSKAVEFTGEIEIPS